MLKLARITEHTGTERANTLLHRTPTHASAPSSAAASPPSLLIAAFCVISLTTTYVIPLGRAVGPVVDPDIWWHLRTGQWICAHTHVPATDPFSAFGHGKPWVAYSWLFEVLVYKAYTAFGLAGVRSVRVLLTLAIAWAIHRLIAKREPRCRHAFVLAVTAVYAITPLISERPWLFTVLCFTLTLDVVLDLRAGRRTRMIWLLPLIFALWANLHIQFVYGLFVLALACAAPLLDRLLKIEATSSGADTAGSRGWWLLVAMSTSCMLATVANPYHVRLHAVILDLAMQPVPYRLVEEHLAMPFRSPWSWCVLGLAGGAAFSLGRRQRLSSFDVLLLITTAYFAFHTQRDVWFVVLAAVAILVSGPRSAEPLSIRFVVVPFGRCLSVALIVMLLPIAAWREGCLREQSLESQVTKRFPASAVAHVKRQGYRGPLYNDFDWGGYLIWSLPELPVAIDGRTNVQGDERLIRFHQVGRGGRGWDADPDLKAAHLVIWDRAAPLASLLRLDPDFELVYEDAVAVVFIARPARASNATAASLSQDRVRAAPGS